jgi:catechol 2,3-dioxygenase-like lactoylglutathione lyase family enzyme
VKLSTEIYTRKVFESRDFYVNNLNFRVKTEFDGFVVIQHKTNPAYELMFCEPDSPFVNEIFHPEFSGKGIIFQMEVDDVSAEYTRIRKLNIPIVLNLVSEPVNGRHFTIRDPNNILIDIVEFD